MILMKNCAILFDACNFKGSTYKVCHSERDLGDVWKNDALSIILVGVNTHLTLFKHDEFKGAKLEIVS